MIVRIVRMEFAPDKVEAFLAHFNASKQRIRNFPGVHQLELHRDADRQNVFYTYSVWEDAAALEAYRHSELFRSVWRTTKVLFAAKPVAYSLVKVMDVE